MATWKSTVKESFDEGSFNIDKLKTELNNVGISFDSIANLADGEFEDFKSDFSKALESLECSAQISFTKGCMYERNGDPGYPDESEFEDLDIEEVSILGKKINIVDCLTAGTLEDLEIKLCERRRL